MLARQREALTMITNDLFQVDSFKFRPEFVSHLGIECVNDVLNLARRPFVATHSACLQITDIHRNLGDEQAEERGA